MTCRDEALRQLAAADFELWELHLYLDTHPADRRMQELYQRSLLRRNQLAAEFELRWGPLDATGAEGAAWLKDPWPWDAEAGCL